MKEIELHKRKTDYHEVCTAGLVFRSQVVVPSSGYISNPVEIEQEVKNSLLYALSTKIYKEVIDDLEDIIKQAHEELKYSCAIIIEESTCSKLLNLRRKLERGDYFTFKCTTSQ